MDCPEVMDCSVLAGAAVLSCSARSFAALRVGDKPALYAVSFGTVLRDRNHQPKEKTMTIKRNTKPERSHRSTTPIPCVTARKARRASGPASASFLAHDDGEGGTLLLDALPLDGRIVLRAPKADE